jgi:hypothetical protein
MKTRVLIIGGISALVILFVFFAPITILSIDGFDGPLETNTPIPFTAKQIGCGVSCYAFDIEFINESGSFVWSYGESQDYPFEAFPKLLFQRTDSSPKPITFDHPGKYTVRVSSDDNFIEKKFTVELLSGMTEYDGIDYYQYVQIQEWLDSCRQGELSDEQCDLKVRELIIYQNEFQIQKPYFPIRIPEICLHLGLICPASYAFTGFEKDGHIRVEYSHEGDDEYYVFVVENNSIKSVWYSGDNFKR